MGEYIDIHDASDSEIKAHALACSMRGYGTVCCAEGRESRAAEQELVLYTVQVYAWYESWLVVCMMFTCYRGSDCLNSTSVTAASM